MEASFYKEIGRLRVMSIQSININYGTSHGSDKSCSYERSIDFVCRNVEI